MCNWGVLEIMVSFWFPTKKEPCYIKVPKRDHKFDNHPNHYIYLFICNLWPKIMILYIYI